MECSCKHSKFENSKSQFVRWPLGLVHFAVIALSLEAVSLPQPVHLG